MEQAAQRCKTIVANLLKFSRSSETEISPLNINKALEDTLVFTQHQLSMNNVELVTQLEERLPPVLGNEHQLQQVFTNLIINAQQAMSKKGGKLTISTHQTKDGEIQINFKDTGSGIPNDSLLKIFDPFFTTKPPGKGTGLGLSVSYGIIQEHNGRILVESKLHLGTTFQVILPTMKPKSKQAASQKARSSAVITDGIV